MGAGETIYEPLLPPELPAEAKRPEDALSAGQQKAYNEVIAHFVEEEYVLPGVEDGNLRDEEKYWLSHECILRYLRAVKWAGAHQAITRLETTLKWRREYGVYDLISTDHVEPEAVTGKMLLLGYDTDGRPAMYLRPSKQNTEESIRQLHLVVWYLERSIDLMGPGVENIALMVDFADRAKNPSLGQARATLNILQEHYPERLGRALITKVPFLLNAFFKLITPFIDPVTRPKMRFNPRCVEDGLFVPAQLVAEWGGDLQFEYVHEKYWPALVRLCAERRGRMWEAWRAAGAKVGVSEWEMKTWTEEKEGEVARAPTEVDGAALSATDSGKGSPIVEAGEVTPEVA